MSALPLDGVRVIDASRVLAGPFATMLLADLGADVIKIEPPDGDETRTWGPPWWGAPDDRRSAYFASVNRNKRSVVLDLRTAQGQAAIQQLIEGAELLVHNYRPATAGRLGLDPEELARRHPRLVVATVGGFPGEDADRPAYDLLAQAVSGLMSVTGEPDGRPMKVGVAVLDLIAGLECAVGALAALVGGRESARRVHVNLVETGVTSLINVLGNHLASGADAARHGNAHPNIAPYETFDAWDGHVVIAVGNDAQFRRLLDVLGLEMNPSFATNPGRLAHRSDLTAWLADSVISWRRDELVAALAAVGVPAGPVNRVSEALSALERDGPWIEEAGGIKMPPTPIHLDGARPSVRRAPPLLGEHTAEVLQALRAFRE